MSTDRGYRVGLSRQRCNLRRKTSADVLSLASAEAGITTRLISTPPYPQNTGLTLASIQQLWPLVSAHHGDGVCFVILIECAFISNQCHAFPEAKQMQYAVLDACTDLNTHLAGGGR